MKSAKQLERHFKGVSNHNRIQILLVVDKFQSITLFDIAEKVGGDIKNISQHTHRLVGAGLLNKKYNSQSVEHSLSPYGKRLVKFIKEFSKI